MIESITDPDVLREVMWDDSNDYKVIQTTQVDNSRWHIIMETVFKRETDGKLFIMDWRKGATENQEHEYPEVAVEAEEFTETIVSYRAVKNTSTPTNTKLPTYPAGCR
jgi:hypothetical protein